MLLPRLVLQPAPKRSCLTLGAFLLTSALPACGQRTPSQEVDADRPAADEAIAGIQAVADSFAAAVRDQDPERFAQLFTEDATSASNDGRLWENQDEIREGARDWMRVLQEPTSTTVDTEVFGDGAYVFQRYSSVITSPRRPQADGEGVQPRGPRGAGGWYLEDLRPGGEQGSGPGRPSALTLESNGPRFA